MAKHKHSSKACMSFIAKHVWKHIKEGMPKERAMAAASAEARGIGCKIPKKKK